MLETLDIPIWIWMNHQCSEIFTRPNWKYALNVLFRELSHAWTGPGTGWKVWYRCEQRRLGSACTLLAPFCSGFYQEQSLPQGADHNFREFWLQKMWISTPRRSLPATSPQPPKNSDSSSSKETDHLDWWEIETPRYPTLISETCHFLLPHFNAFILPSFTVPTVHPSLWPGFYSLGVGRGKSLLRSFPALIVPKLVGRHKRSLRHTSLTTPMLHSMSSSFSTSWKIL